jgi:cysteine desulfurase
MIYADYNGSAPLHPSVREYLHKRIDSDLFANPNAIHSMGQKVAGGIEKCRRMIAEVMGCFPDQIIFNSCSSEGLSHIFHSLLNFGPKGKNLIITSPIEHVVLPSAFSFYVEKRGFEVVQVKIDSEGRIDLADLEGLLKKESSRTALVSIMAVNNETGVIEPYQEIAKLCQKYSVEYVCDTTQLIGKGEFHFTESGVDYAVCSGHKVGALTGSGFLIAKDPTRLKPFVYGSYQESGLRGGTQNYLGIETLAIALKEFDREKSRLVQLKNDRLAFEEKVLKACPGARVIGRAADRLAGTTLIGLPGIHGQAVQIELESHDIFVTTSAACSDNQPETSKVLKAMDVSDDLGRSVIRISLSASHGESDYETLAPILIAAYNKLSRIHSY